MLQVVTLTDQMVKIAAAWQSAGQVIGLVPTMGFLHEGHLSLVKLARAKADKVVLSIFVNPTQFGAGEDFQQYPRDFERDRGLAEKAGTDVIFYPAPLTEMYASDHSVKITESALSAGLCGASRPGHFTGVLTVVAKLFNITRADLAVFGQKDAQQAAVIRRMVRDLNFPLEIVVAPLVRESDGLALSSRNTYLSSQERQDALCLRRALQLARRLYHAGERQAEVLRSNMRELIQQTASARIDYAAVVNAETLLPVSVIEEPVLITLAVYIGRTRLIDNLILPDDRLSNLPEDTVSA